MFDAADIADRQGRILGELADMGLEIARDLKDRALKAASREEAEGLALAFHRISRSIRQSLALEVKLAKDRCEAARLQRIDRDRRTQARKAQVRAAVGRLIWTEHEPAEAERLTEDLDGFLAEDALFEAFLRAPLDDLVARLAQDLGLPANDPREDAPSTPSGSPSPAGAGEEIEAARANSPPPLGEGDREAVEGAAPTYQNSA
ncbi:hypothetical protein [Phenylobacterium sp.]|uniref:hypothetical protein n=1 Tax=Phenylobacterium sp. TaxID=1871053 RepID=UPI0035AE6B6C